MGVPHRFWSHQAQQHRLLCLRLHWWQILSYRNWLQQLDLQSCFYSMKHGKFSLKYEVICHVRTGRLLWVSVVLVCLNTWLYFVQTEWYSAEVATEWVSHGRQGLHWRESHPHSFKGRSADLSEPQHTWNQFENHHRVHWECNRSNHKVSYPEDPISQWNIIGGANVPSCCCDERLLPVGCIRSLAPNSCWGAKWYIIICS